MDDERLAEAISRIDAANKESGTPRPPWATTNGATPWPNSTPRERKRSVARSASTKFRIVGADPSEIDYSSRRCRPPTWRASAD